MFRPWSRNTGSRIYSSHEVAVRLDQVPNDTLGSCMYPLVATVPKGIVRFLKYTEPAWHPSVESWFTPSILTAHFRHSCLKSQASLPKATRWDVSGDKSSQGPRRPAKAAHVGADLQSGSVSPSDKAAWTRMVLRYYLKLCLSPICINPQSQQDASFNSGGHARHGSTG